MSIQYYQFNINLFRDVTVAAPNLSTSMPDQRPGPNAAPRQSIAGSVHSFDDNDGINPRNLLNSSNDRNQN